MNTVSSPLLEVRNIKKHFVVSNSLLGQPLQVVHAVDGIDLVVSRGEAVAFVGESGCGKSTLGRSILQLMPITSGEILLDGARIDGLSGSELRQLRRRMQIVFQDPFSSLNPRMKVRDIVGEPLRNFGLVKGRAELSRRVSELLELVRLPADILDRYPHEFSGGQRQRLGIARALAPNPDIIVFDEAVSALDVSVQAQVLNLIAELQERLGLAMLFISHDLAVVEHLSDRVAVMYLGRVMEIGPRQSVFANPSHPYTRALLSAVPVPDPTAKRERVILKGDLPSPINPQPGCRFKTRCPYVFDRCQHDEPLLVEQPTGQSVACHLVAEGRQSVTEVA